MFSQASVSHFFTRGGGYPWSHVLSGEGGYFWFLVPSTGGVGMSGGGGGMSRGWVPTLCYWHLVAATTCVEGKRVVCILLEYILGFPSFWYHRRFIYSWDVVIHIIIPMWWAKNFHFRQQAKHSRELRYKCNLLRHQPTYCLDRNVLFSCIKTLFSQYWAMFVFRSVCLGLNHEAQSTFLWMKQE